MKTNLSNPPPSDDSLGRCSYHGGLGRVGSHRNHDKHVYFHPTWQLECRRTAHQHGVVLMCQGCASVSTCSPGVQCMSVSGVTSSGDFLVSLIIEAHMNVQKNVLKSLENISKKSISDFFQRFREVFSDQQKSEPITFPKRIFYEVFYN